MRRSLGALVLFFLVMSLLPAEASPDHVEQEVWVDTYIEKESSINYGSKDTIIVGKELVTYYVGGTPSATVATQYRILIRPNLTGISGVVESAKLVLTIAKADPDHDTWIQVYPLTASFDESRVTWYYRDSSNRWSTEGGDYNSSMLLDEVVVGKGANPGQTVELDVTEYVKAVRQGKINNYGIILLPGPTKGWVEFYSTESSNPKGRPKLVVETSPVVGGVVRTPPPATQPPFGGWVGPVIQFWYVSVSPSEVTVLQGDSVAIDVSVETLGANPTVTLSASGVPPDCTASFSQTSGTVPFTTKLVIATSSSTPAGGYNITVQAVSSSGEARSATLTLRVVSTPSPDFRVTVRPPGGAVRPGEAISFRVAVAPDYGFSQAVTIALSNLPADCSYT
ncbi:MAG TPA: DNRLRE domain-containing protein, partial [Candidatus Korarchaeota archaeon]|nr:DNRLRE domain-containing protein [Candidatus Korarchaeota archaeon]